MDGELRAIFRTRLPQVGWSTIETAAVEPGVADSNGCYGGIEFWVEHKKTEGWAVEVKPAQVAWHTLRYSKGGRTFFAVRRRNKKDDELYLIYGRHARLLKDEGLSGCPHILKTTGGPSRWSWDTVLNILTTREKPP